MTMQIQYPLNKSRQLCIIFQSRKTKLKHNFNNLNEHCSCYIATAHLMQCKHMISYNKVFDLNIIGKCWYQRNKITQSNHVGSYVNPRLKQNIPEIDEVELFSISNVEDIYEERIINEIETDQLCRGSHEVPDNSQLNNRVTYSSYMDICNSLYNNLKKYDQILNIIISLLLEIKEILNSKDDKKLVIDNLFQRVDNYKKLFTNLKDNNKSNLIEPSKTHQKNLANERCLHMKKIPGYPCHKIRMQNQKKTCGFCIILQILVQ